MNRTDTIVIGGGQAGLATSRCLTDAGRDHVVLERGRLGERWRSERWDSLRLLTPNWMSRLPGWSYGGPDPDGFMAVPDLVASFEGYAASFAAPIQDGTTVTAVRRVDDGYVVDTDRGRWHAADVVIATGVEGAPRVPAMAQVLAPSVHQVTTNRYRNPDELPPGGVLVVGASASGVQLADELARSGRPVTLSVGRHTRMPRHYRGHDIFRWLERIGSLDRTVDQLPPGADGADAPSMQLVGRPSHEQLDLATLAAREVRLTGRLTAVDGTRVAFADDLGTTTRQSECRMHRVLDSIDAHVERTGGTASVADRPVPIVASAGPRTLDLRAEGISTVLWAAGFVPSFPWLHVPVLRPDGGIVQRRGVTPSPGLYVVGQRFQHFRNSNFIDGVGRDAAFVVDRICGSNDRREEVAA